MVDEPNRDLEILLSLYLDGRLEGEERVAFERLIESNRDLREALEFHRGLTLEFHEEAPPLPAGYAEGARARLMVSRAATGLPAEPAGPDAAEVATWGGPTVFGRPAPWWRRAFVLQAAGAAAAVALVVALLLPRLWESGAVGRSAKEAPPEAKSDADRSRADQQTIDALRSLGYLSGGRAPSRPGAKKGREKANAPERGAAATQGTMAQRSEARKPASGPDRSSAGRSGALKPEAAQSIAREAPELKARVAAAPPSTPAPEAAPSPVAKAASTPLAEAASAPAPAVVAPPPPVPASGVTTPPASTPTPAGTSMPTPGGTSTPAPVATSTSGASAVEFRILPVAKGPPQGSEFLTFKSADDWQGFVADAQAASTAPAVSFGDEMIVVLRDDLGTDPPSRLHVLAVNETAEELRIECRAERVEPSAAPAAGQALLLPKTERRIRIVMR